MTDQNELREDQIEVHNGAAEDAAQTDQSLSPPPPPADNQDEQPPQEQKKPAYDDGRAALAAKFNRTRADKEPPVPSTGDYTDPTQTYGQVAKAPTPPVEPPPVEEPEHKPEPQKFKVKVRGEERELTQEELVAAAQKALAGDSYLEDARQVLETTKTRVQVSRQHPDENPPAPASTDEPVTPPDDGTTPADPLEEAIEQIQYGDPKEAKAKLSATIARAAAEAVQQATGLTRVREDIANDLRAHDEFAKKNADLASDPIAVSVIRDGLLTGYRDDLLKIGVPAENIPTDPAQLANHHRHYKLQGQPVRQVSVLLEAAAERLTQWRGGTPRKEPNPSPAQAQTRIDVNVNRDERRMAIPQQPTRANVQPSMTQPQQQGQRSRSDAVRAAQRARGQAI